MYIGLDPDSVGITDYLWKVESADGIAQLSIKTTDANFHLSTYYFVYIVPGPRKDAWFILSLNQ